MLSGRNAPRLKNYCYEYLPCYQTVGVERETHLVSVRRDISLASLPFGDFDQTIRSVGFGRTCCICRGHLPLVSFIESS